MFPHLTAFALTLAMEWPLLALLSGGGFARTGLFCLGMNGASWGSAMALLILFRLPVAGLECGIILAETIILGIYWRWNFFRCLMVSLVINLASWKLGPPALGWLLQRGF